MYDLRVVWWLRLWGRTDDVRCTIYDVRCTSGLSLRALRPRPMPSRRQPLPNEVSPNHSYIVHRKSYIVNRLPLSPTKPFVFRGQLAQLRPSIDIEQVVLRGDPLLQFGQRRALLGRDDQALPAQRAAQIGTQQGTEMRHFGVDEAPVGAHQRGEVQGRIVNAQFEAAAQKPLRQLHHGALPQVVRVRFEGEAQDADLVQAEVGDPAQQGLQMSLITWQQVLQHRQIQAMGPGMIGQRPNILWQTGAAEWIAWL